MAIYNLGSINADHFYSVPHLPQPGETLAATAHSRGLGGKGANQSVAASKGGAKVVHIGAVGPDGDFAIDQLAACGVDVTHIARLEIPTGHAIINVAPDGENAIVIFSSANVAQEEQRILEALETAGAGDTLILQNETNLASFAAEAARARDMRIVYSAAPFDAEQAAEMLPLVDLLVVNAVEAQQLSNALGVRPERLPVPEVLITNGGNGATWRSAGKAHEVPAFKVDPVDTTGAGDTYLGFFVAGLDVGMDVKGAMTFAAAGAAIQVTRPGTADAIPDLTEVKAFLEERLGRK
jgi:ribokinase